ncbi:hypothetical protein PCANC_27300 [Puccinia coronata f. sp. avenae]|uniref:Uncharacterized protein n=1 Tax=Puccinia coronata f. sp. avenae TaxID=200324 RepID=A0A2N5SC32_9BASI|nr:hypothetical protein PCANC_27300 [Puccinia coronata f. sp. avenae]
MAEEVASRVTQRVRNLNAGQHQEQQGPHQQNIKDVKGPLPLTIFNKAWREDALAFHANKKSRSDEKDGIYAGYEYPNEWSQSFAQWTMNYREFLETFCDLYKNKDFARWIVELAVDISKEREDIKHNVISITRRLEETHYTNNPYAEGGEKYGFDPRTGKPKVGKSGGNNTTGGSNQGRRRGRSNNWNVNDSRAGGEDKFFNNNSVSNTPNQWGKQHQNWGEEQKPWSNNSYGNSMYWAQGQDNNRNYQQYNNGQHAGGNQSNYYNAQPGYNNNSSGYNNNQGGQSGSGTSGRGKKPSRGGKKPAV